MPDHVTGTAYFVDDDMRCGFALVPHNADTLLCGVFRHPDADRPILPEIIAFAAGITDDLEQSLLLDCFAPLAPVYGRYGFTETFRMAFDPKFKPEGWNPETHGTPDVVFMSREATPARIAA